MNAETPGVGRVVRLLTAAAFRRRMNRMRALRKGSSAAKSGRSPTLLFVLGVLFTFQAFVMSYSFTYSVVRTAESRYAPGATPQSAPEFGAPVWVDAAPEAAVLGPFAIVFVLIFFAVLFIGLGTGNTELAQTEWSMEWLFTFPVPTRGLMIAKVGEYGLTSLFTWFTVFPLSTTLYWNAGWGGASLVMGLIVGALVAFSVGSTRVFIETYLRKRLPPHRIKNIQALCTIGGMVLLFTVFAMVTRTRLPSLLFDAAAVAGNALLFAPIASIVLPATSLPGAFVTVAWAVLAIGGSLAATDSLLRHGLLSAGGPYQGTRRPVRKRRGRGMGARGMGGILAKDLHLLMRDRNFMLQTLILPALIVGFQLMVNPALTATGSPRGVAVLAFGVGAYVLAFGGFSVLTAERNALWLLYSLPRRLDRLFVRKTILWGVVAALYAAAVLAIVWRPRGEMDALAWLSPLFVLLGVVLHAFLAGAMGVLGADPFEREMHKKVGSEWSMLYMIVAANYGATLAMGDLWSVLVLHVLLAFVVVAMWERVEARLPYLLDPSASPMRRIQASDGLIAAFAFFCMQQIGYQVAIRLGSPPSLAMTATYAGAGIVTLGFVTYTFWRRKVRDVIADLGLRVFSVRKVLLGVVAGVGCAALAGVYLNTVPVAEEATLKSRSFFLANPGMRNAVLLLTVVLAPVIEEILFRGLLFNGMKRTMRPRVAVLGSAVLFGVVHPAISFLPVFVMGIAAALVLNSTRSIWAAIATHMTYNAIVVGANII